MRWWRCVAVVWRVSNVVMLFERLFVSVISGLAAKLARMLHRWFVSLRRIRCNDSSVLSGAANHPTAAEFGQVSCAMRKWIGDEVVCTRDRRVPSGPQQACEVFVYRVQLLEVTKGYR